MVPHSRNTLEKLKQKRDKAERILLPQEKTSLPTEQEDLCTSESLWAHGRRDKSHAFAEVRNTIPLLSSSQLTHLVYLILFSYLLNVALFCHKSMSYQHHVPSRHMSRNPYICTDIVLTSHFTVHKSVHGYYSITTVPLLSNNYFVS